MTISPLNARANSILIRNPIVFLQIDSFATLIANVRVLIRGSPTSSSPVDAEHTVAQRSTAQLFVPAD